MVLLIALWIALPACAKVKSPAIIINIPSRTLELYSGNVLVKEYRVAVGKPSTPTPVGTYSIQAMEVDPTWIPPDRADDETAVVASGPANPLGYRWLGFWRNYGVHGTNVPSSIGKTVSNGCVRMNEVDVEELYNQVGIGTPVTVTYDRVKLRYDAQGGVTLGIYPDVYERQGITVAGLRDRLAAEGLSWVVNEDLLRDLLAKQGQQVPLARIKQVRVGDKLLAEHAVVADDNKVYVPVWPVTTVLQADAVWKAQTGMIISGTHSVPGIVKENTLYATAEDVQKLFGLQLGLNTQENRLEYDVMTVMYENNLVTSDIQIADGSWVVPVEPLAELSGDKIVIDEKRKTLIVRGRTFPIAFIDHQAYIAMDKISGCYGFGTHWDGGSHTLQLTPRQK